MTETSPVAPAAGTSNTTADGTPVIRRPWRSFFDIRSFSLPPSYDQCITRRNHNLRYFSSNYSFIAFLILVIMLYIHPIGHSAYFISMLLLLLFSFSFSRDLKHPVVFACGLVVLDRRLVIAVLISIILFIVVLTDATWYFVCGILLSAVVIGIHAVSRRTEDLFLDEEMARDEGLVVDSGSQRAGQTPIRH